MLSKKHIEISVGRRKDKKIPSNNVIMSEKYGFKQILDLNCH